MASGSAGLPQAPYRPTEIFEKGRDYMKRLAFALSVAAFLALTVVPVALATMKWAG